MPTEYRTIRVLADKPTWYGQWRTDGRCPWRTAASDYGMIHYASEDAAIAGAMVCAEKRGEST